MYRFSHEEFTKWIENSNNEKKFTSILPTTYVQRDFMNMISMHANLMRHFALLDSFQIYERTWQKRRGGVFEGGWCPNAHYGKSIKLWCKFYTFISENAEPPPPKIQKLTSLFPSKVPSKSISSTSPLLPQNWWIAFMWNVGRNYDLFNSASTTATFARDVCRKILKAQNICWNVTY